MRVSLLVETILAEVFKAAEENAQLGVVAGPDFNHYKLDRVISAKAFRQWSSWN